MSDSLKDRLSSHSNSFEGLLSLIPARYYYDDEANSQWKKKGPAHLDERKAEAKQAKQNKFDPERGSSALDEVKRREKIAVEEAMPDDDVVVYDDNGNVVGESEELSVAELLRLKAEAGEAGEAKPKQPSEAKPKQKQPKQPKQPKEIKPKEAKQPKSNEAKPSEPKQILDKTDKTETETSDAETDKTDKAEESDQDSASSEAESSAESPAESPAAKPGVEELRAKLAARVSQLRAQRKAPGSDASGAPKNREELLAARKQRLEHKKQLDMKRKLPEMEDESGSEDDEADEVVNGSDVSSIADDSSLIFGQIQFADGARLDKAGLSIGAQRGVKRRNALDQLRVLENRREKVGKLDASKQAEIAENAKWSRAILQSEGAKVRDDEKMLRRTIKQGLNQKKKSEKEWKQRLYNVKKGISDRESKRNTNIRAHKEAKKLRLKGKKRREHMKKAGAH